MNLTPAALVILILTLGTSLYSFRKQHILRSCMLHPYSLVRGEGLSRIVLYGLVHADMTHLLFNIVSYLSIAFAVERMTGTGGFLMIYLGSLVLGALPTVLRRRNDPSYRALGASGAIAGLFFSGMLFFPGSHVYLILLPIPIPYPLFGVLFLVLSAIGAKRSWGNIGHDVHLFGALAGFLLTAILHPETVETFLRDLLS